MTSTLQTRSSLAKFQKNLQCTRNFAKVSAISLTSKKRHGHKISMVTAYDYPSAIHVARAEIDVILVGDSLAMVELGHETTQPITVDDMIHHCSAVKRGVEYANVKNPPLLVGDMPFGSYEFENTDIALQNAYRFVKEAGMDAIKVEVSGVACLHVTCCKFRFMRAPHVSWRLYSSCSLGRESQSSSYGAKDC